mmetsp:Transcript_53758/g.152355  ORF Transcript_53758/g.152355 Transcript_53758/m.152355 type:complete len:421 (+) Transcript_53758:3-1265(+)
MRRVVTNTINMDLSEAGHSRFCDETIQALRSERSFLRALEYCREPYYRRAGIFAPVPLLLARSYAQTWGEEAARAASAAPPTAGRKSPRRPASAPMKPPREPQGIDNGTNDTGSMVKLDAARPSTALNRRSVVNRQPGGPADSQLQRMGPCSSAPALVGHIASAPSLKFCRGDSALCTEKNEEAGLAASERPRLRFAEGRGRRRDPSRSREAPRRPAARGFAGPRPPAATMLAMVGRASTFSRSASASADGGDDEEVDPATALFEAQVERLQQATAGLRSQPRIAAWRQPGGSLGSEEPGCVHPGVARAARKVLAEGQAMEQKDNLLKQMRREGSHSTTRKVIAANIQSRLGSAADRENVKVAEVHQRCTRIRKNLEEMKFARNDLRSLKKSSQALLSEQPESIVGGLRDALNSRSPVAA